MEAAAGGGDQKLIYRRNGASGLRRCKSLDLSGKFPDGQVGDPVGNGAGIKMEKEMIICGSRTMEGQGEEIAGENVGEVGCGGGVSGNEIDAVQRGAVGGIGIEGCEEAVVKKVGAIERREALDIVGASGVEIGGVGAGKNRRPKGLNYRKKVSVQNVVEVLKEEVNASGQVGGVVKVKKLGRPKGSKNKPKSAVGNKIDALRVGKDVSNEGAAVKEKKRGRPKGSTKRKKMAIKDECVSVHVGGDVSSTAGAGWFVVKKEDVGTVGVYGSGQVFGTSGVMQPVGNRDNCLGVGLLNKDVIRNIGHDGNIRIPEFSGLGSEGWDMIMNECGIGWSMGSVFNVNQEKLVELDARVTGIEHQIVKRKRGQGRPKGSKNKRILHGTDVERNHRMIDANSQNNCDGDIEHHGKKNGQGGA